MDLDIDKLDLDAKYQLLLSKCEDELICFVCEEWCKSPVKINKCGHYFCSDCIPKQERCCPKCQEVFLQDDIDKDNWYENVRENVQFFKTSLENIFHYIKNTSFSVEIDPDQSSDLPFQVSFTDPKSFKRNAKGESKLHLACKRKRFEEVKELIEEKVDINSRDYACWTPLHEAVQVGSLEIIEELLTNGALINSPGEFYVTPLHKAVIMENAKVIELLLQYGAEKESIDFHGRTPVDCTKRKDLLDIIASMETKKQLRKPQVFLKNRIIAYCHSIDEEYRDKFLALKNCKIISDFDVKKSEITHLIVKKSHKVSFKILLCLISGVIIVQQDWVEDILNGSTKFLTHPVLETFPELSDGIRMGIINELLNKPKLFDGINFYLEGPDSVVDIYNLHITKDFLRVLISAGGGINLKRAPAPRTIQEIKCFPYHATQASTVFGCNYIIIFNDNHPPTLQYKMRELQHKSCKWLIDCVINFKLS